MITPEQARALADKPWFERQIERAAADGRHMTMLEGNYDSLITAKFVLQEAGFVCTDPRNPLKASAFTMNVIWRE